MTSKTEEWRQEIYFRVMQRVQKNPDISTRRIALNVGISNGAAYYCVNALIEKGFVKLRIFTQYRSKANYIYELMPRGIRAKAALTRQFLERKINEYDELKVEISRLETELGLDAQENPKDRSR